MKNAMKKLMSLLLVAVLLVSAVPFQASATEAITIDFTIKDTNENILVQQMITETAGPFSVGQYYSVRGDANYTPIKYWIKNADTGNDGLTVSADHLVEQDSKVVIKVERNPVTLNMDVYFDGKYTKTVQKSFAYGSTVTLSDSLAAEAGYGSYETDVRTSTLAEGQSFTVGDNNPNIQIMVVSGNGNGGSGSAGNTQTETKKNVTIVVKLNGTEQPAYTTEINGTSATVENLIKYKVDSSLISGYTFSTAWTSNSGYMGKDGNVNAGEKVYIAFTKATTGNNGSSNGSSNNTNSTTVAPINIVVKVKSSNNVVWTGTKVPANGKNAVVENLLTYCWNSSWDSAYTVDHVWSSEQQKNVARGETVNAGDTVSFLLNEKNPTTTTTTTTNKFPYNVYLNIYKDTKVGSPDKCVDITNGIALDGVVSLDEVKTVVANYYNANNSYGIGYDGLYLAKGNWVANYVADTQKYDKIDAGSMKQTGYVYINVMISNATAKSTATADSTNPKTGDDIYVAMTVMGISAAALATAMYVFTKKRIVK